ncbi:type 4a pilus biogenesis protein PilO [Patescibacteria group bacterium]
MNAQIKPKQKTNTQTIVAIVLLIVSVAFVFLFLLPEKDKLENRQNALQTKQIELNKLKAEIVRFDDLQQSFEGGEVTMKDVLNLIPANMEEDEVIKILSKLSEEHEVGINSLSFGQVKGSDTEVNKLTITTNVSGGHQDLIEFLESLEKESRKFKVKTISVQILQNRLENMSLSIEAYYL